MTIKDFQIEYDAINSRNIFTNGDTINGRIILEATKRTTIHSLVFLAKGKAFVRLVDYCGDVIDWEDESDDNVHSNKVKYYRIKQDILKDGGEDGREVIEKGRHVFPFSFKIPNSRKIPSSFCSIFGQVVHTLKAELRQFMKLPKKAKTHFTFVCKGSQLGLMTLQHGSMNKKIVLGSGNVSMDVHTRCGYKQGEALQVQLEVENLSSRSVKPKFVLDEKKTFLGTSRGKIQKHEILKEKEKGDAVESYSGKKTVIKEILIPPELSPSILNCSIIKLEYILRVHLKITFEADLVVSLPIVIIPELSEENLSDCSRYEAIGSPNQPVWMSQSIDPPPSYEDSAMYPLFPFGN